MEELQECGAGWHKAVTTCEEGGVGRATRRCYEAGEGGRGVDGRGLSKMMSPRMMTALDLSNARAMPSP